MRAFYRFAENEKLLEANIAENLSLPRRWKRLPKALTSDEIEKLLTPETPVAVAEPPLAEVPVNPSPTAAPPVFPTHTNCACAGGATMQAGSTDPNAVAATSVPRNEDTR